MKTKIRLAGGSFAAPKELLEGAGGADKGRIIWQGDMPLIDALGMRVVDESNEDAVKVYQVSQVAFHCNTSTSWQTVFVVPVKQ